MKRLLLVSLLACSGFGCGKDPLPPLELAEGCQPLHADGDCMLPFPSDFYRVPDDTMPTGFRIELTPRGRVRTSKGLVDPGALFPADGFSRTSTIVAVFKSGVSAEGFTPLAADPGESVRDDSQTLIIDAETGERVPHFVDLDPRATSPDKQALVIHPHVAFKPRTRYIVAIRFARQPDGATLTAPEGFRRLRDSEAKGDPILEPLSARYDKDLFPALDKAGVKRKDLQLAWDFTTGSLEHPREDMLRVRELTLEWLKTHTPTFTVTDAVNTPDSNVWRRISGTYKVPLFVDNDQPGARLFRGADGKVTQNGEAEAPFLVVIPASVGAGGVSAPALYYGHGFFGGTAEVQGGAARNIAETLKVTLVATEWWGMTTPDVGVVADSMLSKPAETMKFTDRVHQGIANWLVLGEVVQKMAAHPSFQFANGTPVFPAAPPRNFLGISQGHILGGVLTPLSPAMDRLILNVGGASFSTMMMRAHPFAGFLLLIENSVKEPLEQQKFIATLQAPFDRVDPASYADLFFQSPLAGSPADRRVLMQFGLGDTSVPNIGSMLHARMIGLKQLTPTPRNIYGLEQVAAPVDGSAVALYDFGHDTDEVYRVPVPPENQTTVHEDLRGLTATLNQMKTFIESGQIVNACSGICDPQ